MDLLVATYYERLGVVKEAAAIVQKCVHCGFCNATCPTYQLLGDELDGEDLSWLEQATAAVA
mgnify:CR=1 FL=1